VIRFTGYGVIVELPRVGHHLGRIFPCTLDRKNDWHLFWWSRRFLSPCKVWGISYNARRLFRKYGVSRPMFVCFYRQDCATRKLPLLNILTGRKSVFFRTERATR